MARSFHNRSRDKEIWSTRRDCGKVRGCRLYWWTKRFTNKRERRLRKVDRLMPIVEPLDVYDDLGEIAEA